MISSSKTKDLEEAGVAGVALEEAVEVEEVVAALTALEAELKEPLMSVAKIEAVASLRSGTEPQPIEADPKAKVSAHKNKEITTKTTNL